MNKLKENKGITLVSLIVTIIVFLILSAVSIKIFTDNGIIGRSKNATSKYKIAEEKEKISLAYKEYKMAKIENKSATLTISNAILNGDEYSGWTITFENGNRYKFRPSQGEPELTSKTEEERLLEKYFLGENGEIKLLSDVMDIENRTFKDIEGAIIPDGSIKFTFLLNITSDTDHRYTCFKYSEKVYKLQCDINTLENQLVELVYEPKGREGQTVKYSYDGTLKNEKDWTVLYDYGDSVEIISPNVMGELTLSSQDEEAQTPGDVDKDGKSNTNIDKAIYSYNNAVKRINAYANSQVTNGNKILVRSVGSNPYNSQAENEAMYSSEKLTQFNTAYNGLGKDADMNYEHDLIRMSYHNVPTAVKYYWLASRYINNKSGYIDFAIGRMNVAKDNVFLWRVWHNGNIEDRNYNNGVRPIVKISSDSIKQ